MIDGNANDFIDKLCYEDHYVIYCGEKYYFNGCCTRKDKNIKVEFVRLEVYNITTDTTIFTTNMLFAAECISALEAAPIWNGKTFWEVEGEMQWVDE